MGSCSSVHRGPDTTTKFPLRIGSKAKRVFAPSPAKDKPLNGENPIKPVDSGFGLKSPEFGSKGEIFFDSKAWLDSDCEDDFFSVNGDFTPSQGTTPNHQTSTLMTPKSNHPLSLDKFPGSKSEPSPTGRKKLADLFQETSQVDLELNSQQNTTNAKVEPRGNPEVFYQASSNPPTKSSWDGSLSLSGANSVSSSGPLSPSRDLKNTTKKATHCCLPSLVPTFSFNERRQKMSPVQCSA